MITHVKSYFHLVWSMTFLALVIRCIQTHRAYVQCKIMPDQ